MVDQVVAYSGELLPLDNVALIEGYFCSSFPLCVIDSAFSYNEDEKMINPNQASGVLLSFFMLSGNDNLSKMDKHMLRFLSEISQRPVSDI